jgi:hypothetical protein
LLIVNDSFGAKRSTAIGPWRVLALMKRWRQSRPSIPVGQWLLWSMQIAIGNSRFWPKTDIPLSTQTPY